MRAYLYAVEREGGTLGVDASGAEGVGDQGVGDLDGVVVNQGYSFISPKYKPTRKGGKFPF